MSKLDCIRRAKTEALIKENNALQMYNAELRSAIAALKRALDDVENKEKVTK